MYSHLTTAVAVVLLGAACAGSKEIDEDLAASPELPDSIYVEVVNDHFYDARIHAVYDGGARHTLGTVHGNGGQTEVALGFEPRALTFEIAFIINGEHYVSHPVDAVRGEVLALRLPPNIDASGFFRRVSR